MCELYLPLHFSSNLALLQISGYYLGPTQRELCAVLGAGRGQNGTMCTGVQAECTGYSSVLPLSCSRSECTKTEHRNERRRRVPVRETNTKFVCTINGAHSHPARPALWQHQSPFSARATHWQGQLNSGGDSSKRREREHGHSMNHTVGRLSSPSPFRSEAA